MMIQPEFRSKLLEALGPLASLYTDPTAFRIYVDSFQRVRVDRLSILDSSDVTFGSPQALQEMIEAVLALYQVKVEAGQSVIDLRLEDNARMQIVLPPISLQGPYVVIRKLPEANLSWEKLIKLGVVNRRIVDLLQEMIYQHQNILVVGGNTSNKVTTAALLAGRIPPNTRVTVVEREHEMQINHPNAVFLEANGTSYSELIRTAALMSPSSPSWLILSDLIGPEAMTVMELLSRGFYGVATLYANGVEDALKRLEVMCLMANPGLGLEQIRVLIASALQVIVYQQQIGNQGSKVIQIVELAGVDQGQYLLQPLFVYNLHDDRFEATGLEPTWKQKD